MLLSLLSMAAFTLPTAASSDSAASNDDSFYRIVHLDCGRKYFTKDWIIALLNEMKADGYNQLQLAFGNDGLRFLLNDMSFEANGTTYSHNDVVSRVEAGNKLQNSSGDASWLTQTEMDEIIATAQTLGIEIVPLLNLPGHANAILDIAGDAYNATVRNSSWKNVLSQNTLNVTSDAACDFGYEIFKKYVDYFSTKRCQYFNFGADEYGNDVDMPAQPHFDALEGTGYQKLSAFINRLAAYIDGKNMTPRTFNDALYYNGWDMQTNTNTVIEEIQCCYWSSGWGGYDVASASTISGKYHHAMINTNGDYYYVLGKNDNFDNGYSYANGFANTAFSGKNSTISNPAGSMFCIWCDNPNAENEQTVAQKVRLPMRAMALRMDGESIDRMDTSVVANGFNADGTLNRAAAGGDNTYTSEVDINLTVGQTSDVYKQAGDVTDKVNKDGFNETVASIVGLEYKQAAGTKKNVLGDKVSMDEDGTYTGVISDGTHYMIVNSSGIDSTTAIDKATKFTVTRTTTTEWFSTTTTTTYTIQGDDGQFLKVTQSGSWYNPQYKLSTDTTAVNWSYSSRDGFSDSTYYSYITYNNGWNVSSDSGTGFLYGVTTEGTDPINETQITFKGNAVGETSVIIGSVKYNIKVTAEDLSAVTPLTVEYWITNQKVTGSDGAKSKTISAASAYGENGVLFSKLVPATGTQDGKNDVFWKGTRLTSDNKQTEGKGVDKTTSGNDFTYIRYWNQQWSFSADGKSWTDFNSDDQVVAYYLQKTNVTDEIATKVVDWGEPQEKYNGQNYVIVDYAVKYLSGGTRVPNSFPVAGKSIGFHCDSSDTNTVHTDSTGNLYRSIGMIKAEATDNYEVYMITLTPSEALTGSLCSNNTKITYNTTDAAAADNTVKSKEKVVWVDNESDLGEFTDPDTHFTSITGDISYKVGGEPVVPGLEIYNKHGMLVTYYVREKETPDSLHVHYIDTTGSSSNEFYSYAINVHQKTTFDEKIALNNPWKGDLKNGSVTNIANKVQTVSSDLSTMPVIGASYRYSMYTCNEVKRSADGKDVYLYYTFSNKVSYVVDFGLPLNINLSDLNASLVNAQVTSVNVDGAKYGTTAYADADKVVTYTPTKAINEIDTLSVTVTGHITYKDDSGKEVTQDGTVSYLVDIIPATSVYYEDSFATFTNANGTKNVAQVDSGDKGIWTKVTDGTMQTNVNQALEALGGTTNTKNVYGYDPAYADSSKFSMGSATKVTVNADTSKLGQSPTATFTFTGTGFDVISLTGNQSGTVMYTVKNTKTGDSITNIVNTYYGYKYENGKWVTTSNADPSALYQIPVIKENLTYGTYEVTISVLYGDYFNSTANKWYTFWLDAIRVYNPMGVNNETYKQDNEGYPQYIKLRDSLAKDNTATADAVFIDGGKTAEIATYANYGPNNEVYLANGQAITFTVPENDKIASIQIGAKAPDGRAAQMVVTGVTGGNKLDKELSSATEMYYKIGTAGDSFTISNTGNGILSLTNLKITFKASGQPVTLATLSTEAQKAAVMSVRALFAAPAEPFQPDRFEASWSRNVRKGGTATLTVKASADVEAITVNGEEISAYTTKTARSVWGAKETYHVFTYRVTNAATANYSICAVNGDGVVSDPITAKLTVRPSIRDWWNGIFDKWKH